jgi:hypothetical protein
MQLGCYDLGRSDRSYGHHDALLGESLRKEMGNCGAIGQLVMDEPQQALQQRALIVDRRLPWCG